VVARVTYGLGESGKRSDRAHRLRGKSAAIARSCFWKVRVWDEPGSGSEWSEPTAWEMGFSTHGLAGTLDWRGVADETSLPTRAGRLSAQEFEIAQMPAGASLCDWTGFFELYVNAKRLR